MVGVVIYGLSTEGYSTASTLIKNGLSATIVDEELQMATQLNQDIIKNTRTVHDLIGKEQLLSIKPIEAALSDAQYIFFTPKIRSPPEEVENEVNSKLREVAKNISKGATLIYNLPVGIGGSESNLALLEKISGLPIKEGFDYVYAPLKPLSTEPSCIGLLDKPKKDLVALLSKLGLKSFNTSYKVAEALHASKIISIYSVYATQIEVYKMLEAVERAKIGKQLGGKDIYIDDLFSQLLDARLILSSLPTKETLMHLTSNILKIVEGFIRILVDEVKLLMKNLELKASKTKIILNWSVDKYEMRGDRLRIRQNMLERLRDYVGDVASSSAAPWDENNLNYKIKEILGDPKTKLLISGSQVDHKNLYEKIATERPIGEYIFVKANLLCETTAAKTGGVGD
ncbi:MAG: hypothetical protein QXJ86_00665 [Nitrososphaerales archaeon]